MLTLLDLKSFLDTVTDAFAAVLDFELTIINAAPMRRVSGTGRYRERESDWEQTYTFLAMKEKQPMVVLDAGKNHLEIAQPTPQHYAIIVYPIVLEAVVEGAIVLASFNEKQHQNLLKKKEALLIYLEKTASLISAKLMQERLSSLHQKNTKQLGTIFETVKEGLLLFHQREGVLQINSLAADFLRYAPTEMPNRTVAEVLKIAKDVILKNEPLQAEVTPHFDKAQQPLFVHAVPAGFGSALCVITPFFSVQRTITQSGFAEPSIEIITKNDGMNQIKQRVHLLAQSTSNVLILGESGTGKELVARMLHDTGSRRKGPFVSVNCAAIPEALLESELFGYEEGAFTGARRGGKIGKFLLASGGTLFLDEIGDMPLYMQAKLLRVLNDRTVERIGSQKAVKVEVRIIAATNKNLVQMIEKNEFREDLFYRLNVIEFKIPPLRRRMEDVPLLLEHFINKYNQRLNKSISGAEGAVLKLLYAHDWPGNVREFENDVEYMVNFEQSSRLTLQSVPQRLLQRGVPQMQETAAVAATGLQAEGKSLKEMTQNFERCLLQAITAERCGTQPSVAQIEKVCEALDIGVATYYRKLRAEV